MYTQESIERLKAEINLPNVIDDILGFPAVRNPESEFGGSWECPFCNTGFLQVDHYTDSYYHCNKCRAYGDAISFLMLQLNLNFENALNYLDDEFNPILEQVEVNPKRSKEDDILINKLSNDLHEMGKFHSKNLTQLEKMNKTISGFEKLFTRYITTLEILVEKAPSIKVLVEQHPKKDEGICTQEKA